MEQILSYLFLLQANIYSGKTIHSCLSQYPAPKPKSPSERIMLNQFLTDLKNPELRLETRIQAWIAHLQTQLNIQDEIAKFTRVPRIQSQIVSSLCGCWIFVSPWAFPEGLKPQSGHIIASSVLCVIGFFLGEFFFNRLKRNLWFADWLLALSSVVTALKSGSSLSSALNAGFSHKNSNPSFPRPLKIWIDQLLKCTQRAMPLSRLPTLFGEQLLNEKGLGAFFVAQTQIIERSYSDGISISESLDLLTQNSQTLFRKFIRQKSESLSFWLLLPLFCFQLPAILVTIVGPALAQVQGILGPM